MPKQPREAVTALLLRWRQAMRPRSISSCPSSMRNRAALRAHLRAERNPSLQPTAHAGAVLLAADSAYAVDAAAGVLAGVGGSTGDCNKASIDDLAGDVVAAFEI